MDFDIPFFYALDEEHYNDPPSSTYRLKGNLYGVTSAAQCPECGQSNLVVTLGMSPDLDYLPCTEFKFFTFCGISRLPPQASQALQRINPNYRRYWNPDFESWCFLNACGECGLVFDEECLRMEPGDAYYPIHDGDYRRIQIIDLGIQSDYEFGQSGPDQEEYRRFDDMEVDSWNPAPELWQLFVDRGSFEESLHSA